ncbi:MAG: ATP-binding cassette domain-containing protein [Fimbriimonadaceae bacterium]|nr:ATP-binding cassette domain-containing protein [Fimbriimonadaceae bacterium]
MIQTDKLTKVFPNPKGKPVRAVDAFDFTAVPGKVHALLGVNGAGKTTVLRMLSTVLKPTSGSATVNGFDVVKDPEKVRQSIGFLSTSTAVYGRLKPLEMLAYFGTLYGLDDATIKRRTHDIAERLDIMPFADRLCDQLSTGQKQRVSIARAILHDPPVVFFDEPTAGLDVLTAQTVLQFIEGCRDQGKTVVFSTHIMSEVERLADDVSVIHEGTLKGAGTPAEIVATTGSPSLEKAFLRLVGYNEPVTTA